MRIRTINQTTTSLGRQHIRTANIVLVGTTSSGKSTIANLLCGHYILPSGVQETTTAVIEVVCNSVHTNMERERTQPNWIGKINTIGCNALPQHYSSTQAVRLALKKSMESSKPDSRHILVEMASFNVQRYLLYNLLALFKQISFQVTPFYSNVYYPNQSIIIKDLPGFQHQSDEKNLTLIRNSLQDADIFLFVYNAEETDDTKENKLADAFLNLLKKNNRNWKNVIFVLNRSDAFLRDNDSQRSLRKTIDLRQKRIHTLIEKIWNTRLSSSIPIYPLSAGPILASEMIMWNSAYLSEQEKQYFMKQLLHWSGYILPKKTRNQLPRDVERWGFFHWLKIYKEFQSICGAKELSIVLKQHINIVSGL